MGWIVDGLPRKTEIWYQDDKGWPDLLSKQQWWWWSRDEHSGDNTMMKWRITCMTQQSLSIGPCRQCNSSQPCKIFATPHTCARSRRPRSGKLQPSNSQWNSRSHKTFRGSHQINAIWCRNSIELQSNQLWTRVYLKRGLYLIWGRPGHLYRGSGRPGVEKVHRKLTQIGSGRDRLGVGRSGGRSTGSGTGRSGQQSGWPALGPGRPVSTGPDTGWRPE